MSWNPGWNPGWSGQEDYGGGATASAVPDGTRYGAPNVRKAPSETVRIDFPFAARLAADETIESVDFSLPDGLTEGASSGTGSKRSLLVSGGEHSAIYRVIATVVTSGGQTLSMMRRVLVMEQ